MCTVTWWLYNSVTCVFHICIGPQILGVRLSFTLSKISKRRSAKSITIQISFLKTIIIAYKIQFCPQNHIGLLIYFSHGFSIAMVFHSKAILKDYLAKSYMVPKICTLLSYLTAGKRRIVQIIFGALWLCQVILLKNCLCLIFFYLFLFLYSSNYEEQNVCYESYTRKAWFRLTDHTYVSTRG